MTSDGPDPVVIREVSEGDLTELLEVEAQCFSGDRLSRRRFQFWIRASHRLFLVARNADGLLGYGLVLLHRGTRLARLYSLAVSPKARGLGLGRRLLEELENAAMARGRLFMRLEVARDNESAIRLYEAQGYRLFGVHEDYYENHEDALRLQKCIRHPQFLTDHVRSPWYQQSTPFTCGPAALMMAMARLDASWVLEQGLELDLWREATTIFMTSGHGGCHPLGLGLAARRRGFQVDVWVNRTGTLFIDGVRNSTKKQVLHLVQAQFEERAQEAGLNCISADITQDDIAAALDKGASVLVLISTYRLDRKRAPHWVCVTGMDADCLYVHDPDPDDARQSAIDCQHVPIARADFAKMSSFGRDQLRTAVILY